MTQEFEQILKSVFRLSLYEAKAYLALLSGPLSAKELASRSGVPLPRIYDTLRSLEAKGFVDQGGSSYFAFNPEIALQGRIRQFKGEFGKDLDRMEEAQKALMGSLSSTYKSSAGERGDAIVIRGIRGIANKMAELFAESDDIILTIRKALAAKEVLVEYLEISPRNRKRIRAIVQKGIVVKSEDRSLAKKLGIDVRLHGYVLLDLMVAGERDVLIGVPDPVSDEPYHSIAVWVRNPSFAGAIRNSLEAMWSDSVEVP